MLQGFQKELLRRHIMAISQIGNARRQLFYQLIRQCQLILYAVVLILVSNILQAEPDQFLQIVG